ncbi:MAG: tryptophan--tRNA ligase [bacterium]
MNSKQQRILSGIQPSGDIHLGNYLGAIKNWVEHLDQYECLFPIVDYHAMTIPYDPAEMPERIYNAVCANIACGLDPERCTLFVQSQVPEHTELCWILTCLTSLGSLERMTQFKEKSQRQADREGINAGLLAYPALMAADILIYKAEVVPVGEDQVQHLELAREIARRFNNAFGETFPEPEAKLSIAPRIMGLDGKNKMSKSLGNHIAVIDAPEAIDEKLRRAVTDENRKRRSDPGDPDICNIFSLHKFFSTPEEITWANKECRVAGIGCIECKEVLIKHVIEVLTPIRELYHEIHNKPEYIRGVVEEGAKHARSIAQETMAEVKEKCGLKIG